jgi:hypothetical protein
MHFPDALAAYPNSPVVLLCRVSEASQVSNGNLESQERFAVRTILEAHCRLKSIVSGHEPGKLSQDRLLLQDAIERAKFHRGGLVAVDRTRLIRAEAFNAKTKPLAEPTPEEIAEFLRLARGVRFVATIEHPELSLSELRSLQVKRGMREKNSFGGRPSTIDYVTGLQILDRHERTWSLGMIENEFGIPKSTLARHIKKHARPGSGPDRE